MAKKTVGAWIPGLMGLVFCIASVFVGIPVYRFVQDSVSAPGRVVGFVERYDRKDHRTTYAPVAEYVVDGSTYRLQSSLYSSSPGYDMGASVSVLYPPGQPGQAQLDSFGSLWFMTCWCAGIGLALLAAAFFMPRFERSAKQRQEALLRRGQKIEATIVGVQRERERYVIYAEWVHPPTGRFYRFQSDPLRGDPAWVLTNRKTVDVFVDPDRPGRHWIDVRPFLGPAEVAGTVVQ